VQAAIDGLGKALETVYMAFRDTQATEVAQITRGFQTALQAQGAEFEEQRLADEDRIDDLQKAARGSGNAMRLPRSCAPSWAPSKPSGTPPWPGLSRRITALVPLRRPVSLEMETITNGGTIANIETKAQLGKLKGYPLELPDGRTYPSAPNHATLACPTRSMCTTRLFLPRA
jgi:hypothetical protein